MILDHQQKSKKNWFESDARFNELYPAHIQTLARRHWTPVSVAGMAGHYLAAEGNVKVLDIGSGVGKFCLAASYFTPHASYYGIEQRKNLVDLAESAKTELNAQQVTFRVGNFTQINFREFDHFYFYNSFYENLAETDKIDESIVYSGELYNYYTRYMFKQLSDCRTGTKLATYHSIEDEIPKAFIETGNAFGGLLKFWMKF